MVAALAPFVSSLLPSGARQGGRRSVEVDIGKLEAGLGMMTVEWRGKPVWIINRTAEMLRTRSSGWSDGRSEVGQGYAASVREERPPIKAEIMVAIGICIAPWLARHPRSSRRA